MHVACRGRALTGPSLLAYVEPCQARRLEATIHETEHFRIHCPAESYASHHVALIGSRLEGAYGVASDLLGTDFHGTKVDVHLGEAVTNYQGQRLDRGGYAVPRRMQIHEVYRPEAAGEGLERSVIVLLFAVAMGTEKPPSVLAVDGLLACVTQQLGGFAPEDQVRATLAAASARGELLGIAHLWQDPNSRSQPIYLPAAADFVGFLIRTHGAERFKDLVRRMMIEGPDRAASGAYGVTLTGLERAWHRTFMVAERGGTGRFVGLWWAYLRPYRLKVAEIGVYLTLSVVFVVALPRMQGLLLDKALIPVDGHALAVIMAILVGGFLVVLPVSVRMSYLTAWVGERVLAAMRKHAFGQIQRLEPSFFYRMPTGDILSGMADDLAQVQRAVSDTLPRGARLLLTVILAVLTMYLTSWKVAVIATVGTPLFYITSRYLGPAAARASREREKELAEATRVAQTNLAAQPVVKAFGLEERVTRDYAEYVDSLWRASVRSGFLSGLLAVTPSLIGSAIQLAVLGAGAWLVIGNQLTIGVLFAFLGLIALVTVALDRLPARLQSMQQASRALERIDGFLRVQPSVKDSPGARPLSPVSRSVRLEGVTFGYSPDLPVLRTLSLDVVAGARVALVGRSGSGKSTVLGLIMRFYDPQEGRVTFDGVDVREGTLRSVRAQVGVVFQENALLSTSIRENIRLGNPGATNAEVEAAAREAEIHDLITAMPEGYNTLVGDQGRPLPLGQRQRIAIARAILRNPALLLVDQVTSALDPPSAAAINETLARVGRGRTTVIAVDRPAGAITADWIYVLDRGTLAEQGTHEELLTRAGLYARLWREQEGDVAGAGARYMGAEASRLEGIPLFSGLEPAHLADLAQQLYVERYPAGEVIVRKGDVGDRLYIIRRGEAEVIASEQAGAGAFAVLREGDYFGEMALLYDVPRTATIRARTPVQLYALSKDDFNALLASTPGLAARMSHLAKVRAHQLRQVTRE